MVGNHATPVAAARVADEEALFASDVKPGSFLFEGSHVKFACPCGCGQISVLRVYRVGEPKPERTAWSWDGNEEKPTLDPSIRQLSGCKHHGFLQNGVWTFCGDSGR